MIECSNDTNSTCASNVATCGDVDPLNFTHYNSLTEEEVIDWVKSQLNVSEIESELSTALANQTNPPITQPPLPWATA